MIAKWVIATIGGMILIVFMIATSMAEEGKSAPGVDARPAGSALELTDSELAGIDASMAGLESSNDGESGSKSVNRITRKTGNLCAAECFTKVGGNGIDQILSISPKSGYGMPNSGGRLF